MFERMILQVLKEIELQGGSVPRKEVLEIGEAVGHDRQGMPRISQVKS